MDYELTYTHPCANWVEYSDDFWCDVTRTQKITAPNKQEALRQAEIFLNNRKGWGDYPEEVKKLPENIELINRPVKLTRILKIW